MLSVPSVQPPATRPAAPLLLPAPPQPLLLPAPPPLTKAQQERQAAERLAAEADEALRTMAASRGHLDAAAHGVDGILRRLDEATVPLALVAQDKAADPAAAWQEARTRVIGAADAAHALGNDLAVNTVGPLQGQEKTLEYAQANMYRADQTVRDATKTSGERTSASAKALQSPLDALELAGARVATAIAQAAAGMGAPASRVAAATALKALDDARSKLGYALEATDPMYEALYQVEADGHRFRADLDQALAGATAAPASPTTYAETLERIAADVKTLPATLRAVDNGLRAASPAARRMDKAHTVLRDAIRSLSWEDEPEKADVLRKAALEAVGQMRGATDDAEALVLGGGRRVIADALAPAVAAAREPRQRLAAVAGELRAKHEENAFLFWGRQYGRVADTLEPALDTVPRGLDMVGFGMGHALELPRKLDELKRLLDDVGRWVNQDREVGSPIVQDHMQRLDRLVRDITMGMPDRGDGMSGLSANSLLENAANFISNGLPALDAAAAKAHQKGI